MKVKEVEKTALERWLLWMIILFAAAFLFTIYGCYIWLCGLGSCFMGNFLDSCWIVLDWWFNCTDFGYYRSYLTKYQIIYSKSLVFLQGFFLMLFFLCYSK
jgi:hypothetical protein